MRDQFTDIQGRQYMAIRARTRAGTESHVLKKDDYIWIHIFNESTFVFRAKEDMTFVRRSDIYVRSIIENGVGGFFHDARLEPVLVSRMKKNGVASDMTYEDPSIYYRSELNADADWFAPGMIHMLEIIPYSVANT
jgi:hypothetical protein